MARAVRRRVGGLSGKGGIQISAMLDPSPKALAARYDYLKDKLLDFNPVWKRLVPRLRQHMGRVWSSQGAAAGNKWPPWKPSYAKRRPSGAMGILTGRLLQQLIKGVLSQSSTSLRYGARSPGARTFQYGVKGGQRARPYTVITPEVMRMINEEWNKHIKDVLRRWPIKTKGRAAANAMLRRKA